MHVHKMYELQKPHLGLLYQKCIENTMHKIIININISLILFCVTYNMCKIELYLI